MCEMLMMICVCFFLFLVSGQPQKIIKKLVFSHRAWWTGKRGYNLWTATRRLPRPRSGKVIGDVFLLHVTIFIFHIWSKHLDKCICITSCQWSIGHMTCAPSSLSDLAALAAVLFRDLARWKKAYALQGIVKDQQWKKKSNWEETRVYHACIV